MFEKRRKMLVQKGNEVYLNIRVAPNAKRSGIEGVWQNNALKIALRAPAVDGKANEALICFLADLLGLKKRAIKIVRGETAREKTVALSDLTLEQVQTIINPFIAE